MKKISVLILAALMIVTLTTPAVAFESEFGGYWRSRFFIQENFNGEGDGETDVSRADSRTRLFYTAHFSEDFKFVTKFEMDAVWGDESDDSYGDISADGVAVEVKNTYLDFNLNMLNFKIGTQPKVIARGFIFDDDFSGIIARYAGDTLIVPFIWIRAYEGGPGKDRYDGDVDYFTVDPRILVGESIWLNPLITYIRSNDARGFSGTTGNDDVDVWFFGLNADAEFDFGTVWFTGIYEYGKVDTIVGENVDVKAYLAAVGASVNVGPAAIHGEFFYASGDDDPDDDDAEAFFVPRGQSYYWSEIMGLGVFDNQPSAGSPGDQISNVMAANLGVSFSPMEKLSLEFDVWYAVHPEDDTNGEDDLGTEVDVKATYKLVENLNLEVVGAYLFAEDATSLDGDNKDDPYEVGMRLSFRF
jgi:hypothetical protein